MQGLLYLHKLLHNLRYTKLSLTVNFLSLDVVAFGGILRVLSAVLAFLRALAQTHQYEIVYCTSFGAIARMRSAVCR
jgi:hypothetical protein